MQQIKKAEEWKMIELFLKSPMSELVRCTEQENRNPEGESVLEITTKKNVLGLRRQLNWKALT